MAVYYLFEYGRVWVWANSSWEYVGWEGQTGCP